MKYMLDVQNPEDRLIRLILIWGCVIIVAVTIVSFILTAAMISSNFNFLNWME